MRMTEDLLTTFNISLVVRGSVSETGPQDEEEQRRRSSVPQQQGVMRCVLPRRHLPYAPLAHDIAQKQEGSHKIYLNLRQWNL